MSLFDRIEPLTEAASPAPGAQVGKMAIGEARRRWGSGWELLSEQQQAGAVAFEILRLYGTKPPGPNADPTERILHDAWKVVAGIL